MKENVGLRVAGDIAKRRRIKEADKVNQMMTRTKVIFVKKVNLERCESIRMREKACFVT